MVAEGGGQNGLCKYMDYLSHCGFGSDFMSCPFYKTTKIENGCRKVQSSGAIVHFCLLPLTADSFSFGAKFQPDVVSLED